MSIAAGARLGSYEIFAADGGGMARSVREAQPLCRAGARAVPITVVLNWQAELRK